MDSKVRKVKYVAGSGCLLHQELSDGQFSFKAGIVYDIPVYSDFLRLVSTGDFIEVADPVVTIIPPIQEEVLEDIPEAETDQEEKEPKKARKDKASSLNHEGETN